MALIKCPECGKKISDMAESCPHCGYPINAVQNNAQGNTTYETNPTMPLREKKRIPTWLSVLIITGSIIMIGGIVLLFIDGKSSDNNVNQDSIQETETVEITYPNITVQGIEPFLMGSSMFDISTKGSYYDTIILEKRYSAWIDGGFDFHSDMNEEELRQYKKEYNQQGITPIIESYGCALVIKNGDTLMKVFYDDKALVHTIEVYSTHIQMENGIHVGMSSQEMYEKHNAKCMIPYDTFAFECGFGDDVIYKIPDNPKNISIKAHYNGKYHKYIEDKGLPYREEYYPLPLELVKDNSVRSIEIYKPKNK